MKAKILTVPNCVHFFRKDEVISHTCGDFIFITMETKKDYYAQSLGKFIKEIPDDGRTIKVDFGPLIEFIGSIVGPAEFSRLLRTVYDDCSINLLDQFIDDRGDETHCTYHTINGLLQLRLLADALDECKEVQTI